MEPGALHPRSATKEVASDRQDPSAGYPFEGPATRSCRWTCRAAWSDRVFRSLSSPPVRPVHRLIQIKYRAVVPL